MSRSDRLIGGVGLCGFMSEGTLSIEYLAGIVDGEGCILIKSRGETVGTPSLYIANTNLELLERIKSNFGGRIYLCHKEDERTKAAYQWSLHGYAKVIPLLERLALHLIVKKDQMLAAIALDEARMLFGVSRQNPRPDGWKEVRVLFKEHFHWLNHRGPNRSKLSPLEQSTKSVMN